MSNQPTHWPYFPKPYRPPVNQQSFGTPPRHPMPLMSVSLDGNVPPRQFGPRLGGEQSHGFNSRTSFESTKRPRLDVHAPPAFRHPFHQGIRPAENLSHPSVQPTLIVDQHTHPYNGPVSPPQLTPPSPMDKSNATFHREAMAKTLSENAELKKQIDQLRKQVADFEEANQQLVTANAGKELSAKDFKNFENLRGQLPALHQAVVELQRENAALKLAVSQTNSKQVRVLTGVHAKVTNYMQTSNSTVASLQDEIGKKVADLESMEQKFEESSLVQTMQQEELVKQHGRVGELESLVQAKESELTVANDDKKAAQDQLKQIQAKYEELSASHASIQAKLNEAEMEKTTAMEQLSKVEQERQQLANDLREKESDLAVATEMKEAAERSLKVVEQEFAQLKDQYRTVTEEAIDKEEVKNLRESLGKYMGKYEQASEEINRINKHMQEIESQLGHERALCEKLTGERDGAVMQIRNLEEANREHTKTIAQLRTEQQQLITDLETANADKQLHVNLYARAIGSVVDFKQNIAGFAGHRDPVVREERKEVLNAFHFSLVKAIRDAHEEGV